MATRRKKRRGRSRYIDAATEAGRKAQRDAAFTAIRQLYCEVLPLWRTCSRGYCRRHRTCRAGGAGCLPRAWKLTPADAQQRACDLVRRGGPRRLRPATHTELRLRRFPPSNFVL